MDMDGDSPHPESCIATPGPDLESDPRPTQPPSQSFQRQG